MLSNPAVQGAPRDKVAPLTVNLRCQREVLMRDITDLMQKHRECSRHLWNTYFWPQAEAEDDWDLRDRFEDIHVKLLSALVLWPLEREDQEPTPAYWHPLKPVSFIRVVPSDLCANACPVLINREIASGYWDHPITEVAASDIDMRFIHYFDWSNIGHRDFEYIQVLIVSSITHPELIGRHALVKPINVRMLFDESVV